MGLYEGMCRNMSEWIDILAARVEQFNSREHEKNHRTHTIDLELNSLIEEVNTGSVKDATYFKNNNGWLVRIFDKEIYITEEEINEEQNREIKKEFDVIPTTVRLIPLKQAIIDIFLRKFTWE